MQSWKYKHDSDDRRHYGPVAQDFYEAFGNDGYGTIGTETTLTGSDVSGINMIAVQALEKRTSELKQQNDNLIEQNQSLIERIEELESMMNELRGMLKK